MLVCLGCAGWAVSVPGAELMACQVLPAGRLCLPLCSATVNAEPTDCCRGNTTFFIRLSLAYTQRSCILFPHQLFSSLPPSSFLFYHSFPPSFYTLNLFPFFRLTFVKYKFTYVKKKKRKEETSEYC